MIWLAAHMWFLLLFAFATGLGVGWWIWGARNKAVQSSQPQENAATLGTLESDYAPTEPTEKND